MGPHPMTAAPIPATAAVAPAAATTPYADPRSGIPNMPAAADARFMQALTPSEKGPRLDRPLPSTQPLHAPAMPCDSRPPPKGASASEPAAAHTAIKPTRLHCFAVMPMTVSAAGAPAG